MSTLKELNGRLLNQPYLAGYTPSAEDAKIFAELFGSNVNVVQWASRMASYYQAERAEILKSDAPAKVSAAPAKAAAAAPADEDDDVDLFGEETEEEKAALAAKKAKDEEAKKEKKKKEVIAKSSILLDIKPWDDTIDLKELAAKLHATVRDGLLWGDFKMVPIAFGVNKLQQLLVIEDDKVSGDDLEDLIMSFEDDVQSIDIVAWNKV